MFRILALMLFCAGPLSIAAPPSSAGPASVLTEFDAASMTRGELRLVQIALASTGDYRDRLDGVWGPNSQRALDVWAAREFDDLPLELYTAVLAISFLERVETEGWDFATIPEHGVSLALPLSLLRPVDSVGEGRRWSDARGGRLSVEIVEADTRRTVEAHARRESAIAGESWTIRSGDLMVTAGRLPDGGLVHLRSARFGRTWSSVHLAGGPEDAGALTLMAASIEPGAPAAWNLPPGGRLETLIAEAVAFLDETGGETPIPPERVSRPPSGGDLLATGTGFYLAERMLITARHVIDGCARITLADGTDLALSATDPDLDVAALIAPAPSTAWLRLSGTAPARLGQTIHAVGFPYYSLTGTAMHLTSGNVSALAGMDDDARFVSFTAPVQPGNSGGPLIDRGGAVTGVVIARLSDSYITETTGTMPQNVNFALSTAELRGFLDRNGLDAATDGLPAWDMGDGAPARIADAVVPIVCH